MKLDSIDRAILRRLQADGTLSQAALAEHAGASAASCWRRIKALEGQAGQVLVRRTRPCTATDAGRQVYVAAGFFDEEIPAQINVGSARALIRSTILGQTNNAITDYFQTTFNDGTVTSSGTNNLIRRYRAARKG